MGNEMQLGTIFPSIGRTTRLVLLISGVTLVVLLIASTFVVRLEHTQPSASRLPYYQFYFTIFSTILGGFVVAMIPAILAEARADFEQLKVARAAYSEAKTGFDYLKLKLITMTLTEAADHVQQVHVKKHFAELFPQFIPFLRKSLNDDAETQGWTKNFYNRIIAVRFALQSNADEWDRMSPTTRLKVLDDHLPNPEPIPD